MSSSRPVFRSRWLPYLLVAPQLIITVIFFIWPAGEALWYSLQSVDPFGFSSQFVGLDNFVTLFHDSYAGLTLPLMASATATFLFRQFFMTLPDELVEAARIDGASPMRFFCDIVFPLSKTNLAALFVITFIYGWNQYLWPLLIITDVDLGTTVAGIKGMIATGEGTTEWNSVMAAMLLTLIPPVVIVLVMQRAFVRGLVDSEK